uniref:Ribosome biogenesis protein BOP1 homolog n=1 Tax=Panagrellus redivivus TaxID=6233 RepID=A0A7E4VYA7_PANRE
MVKRKQASPIPAGPPAVGEDDRFDSSDEEDLRNTIGNVPIEWYDEYDHVGYDLSGQKIAKTGKKKDELDNFLEKMEDPDYWRKVFDRQTGGDVTLTDEQVAKLRALATNAYPEIGYNPYEPFMDIFSSEKEIHPLDHRPPDKRSFVPSADERRKVSKMVHAIKMGWTKTQEKEPKPKVYDIWAAEDFDPKSKSELKRLRLALPAPKIALPGNYESYNPPEEYLFDEKELKKWEETEPDMRRIEFIPQKFDALRKVPFYERFFNDRYDRCLDLFMAPRQHKNRLNVNPDDLLPDLPNPRDLMPFPLVLGLNFRGHKGQVRTLAVEPKNGEILVSGGEDQTVRVWYIPTGRCLKVFEFNSPITSVSFNPNPDYTLVAVASESTVVTLLNIEAGDKLKVSATKDLLINIPISGDSEAKWRRTKAGRVEIDVGDSVRQVTWHRKGDYFATVGLEFAASNVKIHQISTGHTQQPFTKKRGHVQAVQFHPTKGLFFVASKEFIRVYDLLKCVLVKKLTLGTRWVSCMSVETHGDNLFVGGLDRAFSWLDLDLSTKPWKTLKHHNSAIRGVAQHQRYPLLATVSDDATAMIYHIRIPQDIVAENEIIPVKRLSAYCGSKKGNHDLTILSTIWHATQPWLITGAADGLISLFSY